jgi:hypothetical protein
LLVAHHFVFIIHENTISFLSFPLGKHAALVQNGPCRPSLIGAWVLLSFGKNTKLSEYLQYTCHYMFIAFFLFREMFRMWFAARD